MSKRLVWLVPEMPYPPNTGGRLTLFKRIEYASLHGYEIGLMVVANPGECEVPSELDSLCEHVEVFVRKRRTIPSVLSNVVRRAPYCVSSRVFPEMRNAVLQAIDRGCVNAVVVDFPQMLVNMPENPGVPVILNQHNCEWKTMASLAHCSAGFPKMAYWLDSRKLRLYERRALRAHRIDGMTFVTELDRQQIDPDGRFAFRVCRPGGNDYLCESKPEGCVVLFVANFGYEPNVQGAAWLAREVMPIVWERSASATLALVGKDPDGNAARLCQADPRITATGLVDDLLPCYDRSAVVTIPIFEGGGIKMKTLEAASTFRPIVATEQAIAGSGLRDGEHVLIAASAPEFAVAVTSLLEDEERARRLASNCRRYYEAELTWDSSCANWYDFVEEVVEAAC